MSNDLKALILGDIIGQPGCRAIFIGLKNLIKKYKADFVIINGENAADGFGITPDIVQQLFQVGVDVITTGNHVWQQREILPILEREERLLRPANYPSGVAGKGLSVVEKKGHTIAVMNLLGRHRLASVDCPFKKYQELFKQIKSKTKTLFIDFHAELPEEKEAFALYCDGKASVVFGTHTHVQTADEKILPKGTGYITDLGAISANNSVIGFSPNIAIQRSLTQVPVKMEVHDSAAIIHGIFVKVDTDNGKCLHIERVKQLSSI